MSRPSASSLKQKADAAGRSKQSFMVLPASVADKLIGTNAAGLSKLALRLLKYLQQRRENLGVSCTLSIGIATTLHCPLEELLKAADTALYQSKERGRNTVTVYRPANENTQSPNLTEEAL